MPGKGRPFKKGNKFGKGRPPLPSEIRKLKHRSKAQVEKRMIELLGLTRDELREVMEDPECQMIDMLIGSIIMKGVKGGDPHRLNFILDRVIGKVPDKTSLEVADGAEGTMHIGVAYVPKSQRAK